MPLIRDRVIDTVTKVLSLSSALGAIKLRAMSHFDTPIVVASWVWTKLSQRMDGILFN